MANDFAQALAELGYEPKKTSRRAEPPAPPADMLALSMRGLKALPKRSGAPIPARRPPQRRVDSQGNRVALSAEGGRLSEEIEAAWETRLK